MRAVQDGPDAGARGEAAAAGAPEEERPGAPSQAPHVTAPLVLPCPLVVLGTTQEGKAGKPLGDLLRRIAYL
ncbi:MAG TPA: hypothetical protein VIG69_01635 [Candidatus Methylomirabilis sp.]|jgi:hypothetical protein